MNNYHLYEEIGQGKFSIVYKGRKRHTIRYVAVKSIEKSRRDKVMTEVSVISQLRHPNIVGFVNWYETRHHLWIIFEYCAGGDVLRLLRADGCLPEDMVRRFSQDVCAGLLHVHSRSIIYSDLKPANLLCNEDGTLKLCDFGHSQRLEDIRRAIEERATLPRRGTPHYMAPELFHEGGMHSFASDLWALGCVLHEMLVGRPPFHCSSFPQLQQSVMRDPTPLTGGGSAEMQALLAALLRKSPLSRAEWPDVRAHTFWQGRAVGSDSDARVLPTQPHLEELRRAWQSAVGSNTPSASGGENTSTASPSPSDLGPKVPSRQSPTSATAAAASDPAAPLWSGLASPPSAGSGFNSDPREPMAEREPPRNVGRSSPVTAAPAVSPSANATQAAGQPPIASSSGLRAQLGAPTYARVREIVSVAEAGVRPISRNPQIEEPEPLDTPLDLPFAPLRLEEVCARPHAELEAFLVKVYKCIAQGSQEQKLSALRYLEQICCHMQVADIVVNSSLLRLVLRMLHARRGGGGGAAPSGGPGAAPAATPALRVRLLSLIGQLLRHVTYLEPGIADLGLLDALLEGLAVGQESAVRRRSAAALGELLFYVATQPPDQGPTSVPPAPGTGATAVGGSNDGGAVQGDAGAAGWQVPAVVLQSLVRALASPEEDEVVQHYVAKTIENVATQCPSVAQQWFFSIELLRALATHVRRSSWDPFRQSCLAATAHLLRGRSECDVSDVPLVDPELVVVGFGALAPQGVPHAMQLVATVLLSAPTMDVACRALPEHPIELTMGAVSQPRYTGALRGRACLLLAMMFALDDVQESKHIRAAIDCSFVPHVDRLGREKDQFVVQCVAASTAVMDVVAVAILQSVVESLRNIVSAPDAPSMSELAVKLVQVLPLFLHILSSATLCACVFGSRALPLLGAVCDLATRSSLASQPHGGSSTALHQLQPMILMIMEAVGSQQTMLLEHAPQIVRCVLPSLAACLSNGRSDVRLLALKAFSAMSVMLVNDDHVFDPTAEKATETTALLEALLCGRVLPVLPTLLGDEAPAPSCALRLLAALLSRGSGAASVAVKDLGLAQPLLAALRRQPALSLHTALLVHCLLRGRAVCARDLRDAGVFDAVYTTLSEAAEAVVGHPAQMDFAMVDAALCVAEEVLVQGNAAIAAGLQHQLPSRQQQYQQQQPQSLSKSQMQLLSELGPLSRLLPVLAMLCAPLAQARLAPLLDRATSCCHHLADLARSGGQNAHLLATELSPQSVASLLESLAAIARWRPDGSPNGSAGSTGTTGAAPSPVLLRRLLAVLSCGVAAGLSMEIRAELAMEVERLLRDRLFGDDPTLVAEARCLISAAVTGRNAQPSPAALVGGRM